MCSLPRLDNITIVLKDTKTPANIGAVARCMMNMGLSRLTLVNPPVDRTGEASKLAAGADAVLMNARTCASLDEAVSGHGLVIGTSRHPGRQRKNVQSPREIADSIIPSLDRNKAAIVFGNEVNGLDNQDLALCSQIVSIPSSADFPSLNLSHAVMIVAYELFLASRLNEQRDAVDLAPSEEVERFFQHLQTTLQELDFIPHDQPERMMFTIRQLFGRSRMTDRDVSILRGILSAVNRAVKPRP